MRALLRSFYLFAAVVGMTCVSAAQGPSPDVMFLETGQLQDPALEQRAVTLGRTLRCVVCANQSIEDSEVEMAQTLRRYVRERLSTGINEDDIRQDLIQSYGEFVSYEPSRSGAGWLLWLSPWIAMVMAGFVVFWGRRKLGSNV